MTGEGDGELGRGNGPRCVFPLEEALSVLRGRIRERPEVFLVLGSGLGALADEMAEGVEIPYGEIPGFPEPGVAGHSGRLVAGRLEGRPVLLQAGRFHLYQGHSSETVQAPVRLAAALGAGTVVLTNAAGGIGPHLPPGSLLLVEDHLNLMFRSPLAGPPREGEERFPDMSAPYHPGLQDLAREVALSLGIPLARGTYAAVLGPSYETPAEVRFLARVGAQAVGMSTVPEATVARALGLRVLAISLITNLAAGLGGTLSHEEVLEVGRVAGARMARLVRGIVGRLPRGS